MAIGQSRLNRIIDEVELGIAIGIVGTFVGFTVGLQAEIFLLQQLADDGVADLVTKLLQFGGKPA